MDLRSENSGGDTVKAVIYGHDCNGGDQAGSNIDTNLGPDDSSTAGGATASIHFQSPGAYRICYGINGNYNSVGSNPSFFIQGSPPTAFVLTGGNTSSNPGQPFEVEVTGGTGLDTRSSKDAMKLVPAEDNCYATAEVGGSGSTLDSPDCADYCNDIKETRVKFTTTKP